MTSPCSQDYFPLLSVCSFPQGDPMVWEHMSVPMLLSEKVVWLSFHQFWLNSAWAVVACSLLQ